MSGLLNASKQPAAPAAAAQPAGAAPAEITSAAQAGAESIDDPVLKQAEQAIEQSVPQEHRKMYDSILVAGMNVMFSKQTANLMEQQLDEGGDIANNVSDGVAKLIMIVFNESKQAPDAFAPAAALACVSLMCQALDYAEQSRDVEITPEMVAQCTKQTQIKVMRGFGVTEDQLNQVAAAGLQQGGAVPDAAPTPPMEA